jgi:hypothetical protein
MVKVRAIRSFAPGNPPMVRAGQVVDLPPMQAESLVQRGIARYEGEAGPEETPTAGPQEVKRVEVPPMTGVSVDFVCGECGDKLGDRRSLTIHQQSLHGIAPAQE